MTAESEIMDGLNRMLQTAIKVDVGDYPEKLKEDVRKIFRDALSFAVDELDPQKINRLVYQEMKKKRVAKLE